MKAKYLLTSSIVLLGLAMPVFANDPCCPKPQKPCPPPCVPVCCPAIVEDCCTFSRCPPTNQVTPNAGPRVKGGYDFFIEGAFTYWTAHEDGLAYAFVQDGPLGTTFVGSQVPSTQVQLPSFDWRPGFKLGIGMSPCYDGWDVFLDYTWFRSNSNRSSVTVDPALTADVEDAYWLVNAPLIRGILDEVDVAAPFVDTNTFNFYEQANAKWGVQLNVFDLELGRNAYVSRRITLRPYVGLKGMWGHQRYTVAFSDPLNPDSAFSGSTTMNNKIKNWGIGIRPGIDTAWHLGESFSLLGEFAFTALWEQFKVTRVDQTVIDVAIGPLPAGTVTTGVNHTMSYYNLKPVVELFLGFRWETWTCKESFHFAIDAGWEQQIWFGQNQFLRIEALDSDHGDLGIQGVTVRARMDF
ncbi:MAG: Lpg1974 family pore-forming outer membrane protein [Chlamydiota bacterium]